MNKRVPKKPELSIKRSQMGSIAGRERSFENTLWNSVAVLGDRDIICAIVGSLMALVVGKEKLPKTWIEWCEPLPSSLYSSRKVTPEE